MVRNAGRETCQVMSESPRRGERDSPIPAPRGTGRAVEVAGVGGFLSLAVAPAKTFWHWSWHSSVCSGLCVRGEMRMCHAGKQWRALPPRSPLWNVTVTARCRAGMWAAGIAVPFPERRRRGGRGGAGAATGPARRARLGRGAGSWERKCSGNDYTVSACSLWRRLLF